VTAIVAPDVELIVCDFLRDHADVVALGTVGVSTALPSTFAPGTDRYVTVTQTDAQMRNRRWTVEAAVDVNCWAPTRAQASELARTASAALLQGLRGTSHDEGDVVNVVEESGPQWLPDVTYPDPASRFVFAVLVAAHPPRS
jgi:hypothetical protein